jgi:predicted dehydrogenase
MKTPPSDSRLTRRQFLTLAGAALAVPAFIPSRALGRADVPAPSKRITLGIVGCGNQGTSNLRDFLRLKDCQVVAACDVDKKHLQNAVNIVNKQYDNTDCQAYHDYRELMARADIDAVMIATPDHWHGIAAVEAARRKWRWNYNTGGGQIMDWIGHHCDIAHWGCDFDNSGPSEIEGHGEFPPKDAVWNTCTTYRIELRYPRDITMTIAGGHKDIRPGTKWIGTDGWVYVERGVFEASNEDWRDFRNLPDDLRKVKLYESTNHWQNFLDCVKSRKPTITPAETAHHSTIPGHLGIISMLVGRKIKWDAQTEKILGDSEASKLLTRDYRKPWVFG